MHAGFDAGSASPDGAARDGTTTGATDAAMDVAPEPVDGGDTCSALPGCTSTTSCPAGDGCNTCSCEQGAWECTGYACGADSGRNAACPVTVQQGSTCTQDKLDCQYPLPPAGACTTWDCYCDLPAWYCIETDCDAGSPTQYTCPSKQPAASAPCTVNGAACEYGPCESYGGKGINCLCFQGGWQCSALPGCDAGGR